MVAFVDDVMYNRNGLHGVTKRAYTFYRPGQTDHQMQHQTGFLQTLKAKFHYAIQLANQLASWTA